jgi:hypothetical protein
VLLAFAGNPRNETLEGLPFRLQDYLELVDWTGRAIRDGKHGAIDPHRPTILERLDIDPGRWLVISTQFESRFKNLVGVRERMQQAASILGFKRCAGAGVCRALLE